MVYIMLNEGHIKYDCKYRDLTDIHRDFKVLDFKVVHAEYFYEICECMVNHYVRVFMHKIKNDKPKWCDIYEEPSMSKW